jgi:hypothetical protein
MIYRKRLTFPIVAVVATVMSGWVVAGKAVPAQAATARPDLTGEWQLNPNLSENAEQKIQDMHGEGGQAGHHGGFGGGGGGQGGHHGGGGGAGSGGQSGMAEMRELILNPPTRFVVTQDERQVVLTEPEGRVRELPTNNRKVKIGGRDARTKWENNCLVTKTKIGDAKLVETYERSPGAPQLIVTTKIDMSGQHVSVRRVYDAVKP